MIHLINNDNKYTLSEHDEEKVKKLKVFFRNWFGIIITFDIYKFEIHWC
jgi:hypothetical protein